MLRSYRKIKTGVSLFWTTQYNRHCNCNYLFNIKQESPADARVTRDSAVIQDGSCSKMAVTRHLGYYRTGNSAIRSADPENPCLETDVEWIGCTVCEIFAFELYCDLETGVRGHSRSLKVAP